MPEYGQFCPVAKASDIIGERWTDGNHKQSRTG